MVERKLTTSNFIDKYVLEVACKEPPTLKEFKENVIFLSSRYDISPILPKLPYLFAKTLQVLYKDDTEMQNLMNEKF